MRSLDPRGEDGDQREEQQRAAGRNERLDRGDVSEPVSVVVVVMFGCHVSLSE